MPAWNGPTGGGVDPAQVQAACAAAIAAANLPDTAAVQTAAETGAANAIVAANLPDTVAVEAAAQTGSAAAITAAGLPTAAEVATAVGAQAACAAAITAAVGTDIPSVAQIQSGLATSSSIAGLNNLSQAQAQSACSSAISAAAGGAIPSVSQIQSGLATSAQVAGLNDLSQSQAQTACASAITGASGTDIPNTTQITLACQDAINNLGGLPDAQAIAQVVAYKASGINPLRTTVTASGAATSGTLLSAPGLGLRNYVMGVLVSCTAAQSTFQLTSVGALITMGQHSILQNGNLFCVPPFSLPLLVGGSGSAITWNKTTAATLVIEVWYYQAA